jgi:tetratricopeptide (TPR) repeat protein
MKSGDRTTIPAPADVVAVLNSLIEAGQAGGGDHLDQIPALVALHPNDVNVRHRAGAAYAAAGKLDAAESEFRAALEIRPRFHFSEFEIGNLYWRRGLLDDAAAWFEAAIRSGPEFSLTYVSAARLERQRSRHIASLLHFQTANMLLPNDQTVLAELVDSLVYHGLRVQAAAAFERASRSRPLSSDEVSRYLNLLAECGNSASIIRICEAVRSQADPQLTEILDVESGHARLSLAFGRDETIIRAAAREHTDRWAGTELAATSLRSAIVTKTPYSLIRVGDGEARFLLASETPPPGGLARAEQFAIGEVIWRNWFGCPFSTVNSELISGVRHHVLESLLEADLLGVATADRLAIDRRHFGYLGYLDKLISDMDGGGRNKIYTDASVNFLIHKKDGYFKNLLQGIDWIGVISPHTELAGRLSAKLGLPFWKGYDIPGEFRLPPSARTSTPLPHFPNVFLETMNNLSVPQRGSVFLVAAGLLGKIYCARIKQLGGIAIDIGSIADGWMGFNTRPGQLDDLASWRL